jgi:tetratricopeptide (TPR) repeat protein
VRGRKVSRELHNRTWRLSLAAPLAILLLVASGGWGHAERLEARPGPPRDRFGAVADTDQIAGPRARRAAANDGVQTLGAAAAGVDTRAQVLLELARRGRALIRDLEAQLRQWETALTPQLKVLEEQTKRAEEAQRRQQQIEQELADLRGSTERLLQERTALMGRAQAVIAHAVRSWPSPPPSSPPTPPPSPPRATPLPAEARVGSVPPASPPAAPPLETAAGQNDVRQMMTYAMTKGGVDHEAEIAAAKRRLEAHTPLRRADPGARRQARAANERGRSALQESRGAEAVQAFQAAYTADPTDVEIINNLGYAYLFQGDLQTAEVWLLRALVLLPGRSIAWANLGHVYAAEGNLRGAVACFANAYRFALRKEPMRKSLESLARDNENDKVREAAGQALQLPLVQAAQH